MLDIGQSPEAIKTEINMKKRPLGSIDESQTSMHIESEKTATGIKCSEKLEYADIPDYTKKDTLIQLNSPILREGSMNKIYFALKYVT